MTRHALSHFAMATALAALAGAAHADLSVFTSQATFNAAARLPGTDTFAAVPLDFVGSPASRSAGPYAYTVSASGGLYGVGSAADVWLSTNLSGDTLTFSGFGGNVGGIGGFFFGSDITGSFLAGQSLTVTAVDSLGTTAVQTLSNASPASFLGFISSGSMVSLSVSPLNRDAYATVNNLTLAAIPEPEIYALLLAGLGAVAFVVRRRDAGMPPRMA